MAYLLLPGTVQWMVWPGGTDVHTASIVMKCVIGNCGNEAEYCCPQCLLPLCRACGFPSICPHGAPVLCLGAPAAQPDAALVELFDEVICF